MIKNVDRAVLLRVPLCGKNNDLGRVDRHAVRAAAAMGRHVLVVVQSQSMLAESIGVAMVWAHVFGARARTCRVAAPASPVCSVLHGSAMVVKILYLEKIIILVHV